jgi:protein ImuB
VALVTADASPVDVDERGTVSGPPAFFSPTGRAGDFSPVESWAGPWPVTERWWDPEHARSLHRFQLVDEEGNAWLLALEDHRWWAEGRYD